MQEGERQSVNGYFSTENYNLLNDLYREGKKIINVDLV